MSNRSDQTLQIPLLNQTKCVDSSIHGENSEVPEGSGIQCKLSNRKGTPRVEDSIGNTNHLTSYLGSLTDDDIARIASLFGTQSVDLAATIRRMPSYAIATICTGDEALSLDSFWEATFGDEYPDIYQIFADVLVTERMKVFHDEYRPLDTFTSKKGLKREYHFWEHLMGEMGVVVANCSHLIALQAIISDEEPSRSDYESLADYPFITVFLAPQNPKHLNQLVDSDSPVFGAIEWDEDSFNYASRHVTGPNVLSVLFKDKRLTNDIIRGMLEMVVRTGRFNVFKLLLAGGEIDTIAFSSDAIDIAAKRGYTDILELLLTDRRFGLTIDGDVMILDAITSGRSEVLKLLIDDKRALSGDDRLKYLHFAVAFGDPDIVKLLLEKNISPDTDYDMMLHEAGSGDKYEVVKLLLDDGRADPTANNHMVIDGAIRRGHDRIAKLLLADERITQEVRDEYIPQLQNRRFRGF